MAMQAGLSLLQEQPLAALPVVFAAGLATSFTPCIYPMIPITAGILAGGGAGGRSRSQALVASLLYGLGLALVYSTLGLLAGLTGADLRQRQFQPMGLSCHGEHAAGGGPGDAGPVHPAGARRGCLPGRSESAADPYAGAFAMGATSGLVAAPCGAPVFAAVLTFVAATGSAALGFLYLFVFSLGMTALLVVVGASAGSLASLPRAGRWTLMVKRAAGVDSARHGRVLLRTDGQGAVTRGYRSWSCWSRAAVAARRLRAAPSAGRSRPASGWVLPPRSCRSTISTASRSTWASGSGRNRSSSSSGPPGARTARSSCPGSRTAWKTYGEQVQFIGVNVTVNQKPDRVRRYIAEHEIPFLVLFDDKATSIRAYQAPSTAYFVITDASGKVFYTGLGVDQQFEAALKAVTASR